ncbi:bifunctional hydroxymethylpyrimidine kinase/phosphomethylpyrimidine kinase [Acidimangrovimonas sediminis]|uniref:bifunctional hydroxymethylpyrimidine kinase/phosphomethylpyrimidine kinase n=1 Tax=Acidimangrovimonas sediminis TaxID=2056283 RepID=UPI000C80355D|nr:hydroxymethylpyrimidine/phosphomethylpyrimidine kinase [Acidimangrovimonas sediminis]
MNLPALLLIGGMDSSGGAGIVRDTVTVARFGLTPRVVVTAVTAQTDAAVEDLHPVPAASVAAQMQATTRGTVGAVKIGMLGRAGIVRAVAAALPSAPLVLDPVLAASSGRALLDPQGVAALIAELLPRVTLLTPNLPELDRLGHALGLPEGVDEGAKAAACLDRGCGAVLVKGGHGTDPARCEDRLYRPGTAPQVFSAPRQPVALRGTGCHLASAIAAGLCHGADLAEAIIRAREDLARRFASAPPRCDAP